MAFGMDLGAILTLVIFLLWFWILKTLLRGIKNIFFPPKKVPDESKGGYEVLGWWDILPSDAIHPKTLEKINAALRKIDADIIYVYGKKYKYKITTYEVPENECVTIPRIYRKLK